MTDLPNYSHWNYRVMKRTFKIGDNEEESLYRVHEVYYENGEPSSWTADPTYPSGNSLDELKEDVELYMKAFDKPVLDYDDKRFN